MLAVSVEVLISSGFQVTDLALELNLQPLVSDPRAHGSSSGCVFHCHGHKCTTCVDCRIAQYEILQE